MEKLTVEEKKIRDEKVAKVEAEIKAAAAKRKFDKVVETEEEEEEREEEEYKRLVDAREGRDEVTKEDKIHVEARDARIKAVKAAIEAARIERDRQEKEEGLVETDGVKLDRLAKEAKDLEEASVLNVIEPFNVDLNNIEMQKVADKLSEVITYLNVCK